jgi:hypothetical protein
MMKKEDILARCIDDIKSGQKTLEDCMGLYPELDARTWQLLKIALRIPGRVPRSREEILADCVRDIALGASPFSGGMHPETDLDEEMLGLLEVAASVKRCAGDPAPGFKEKAYRNLVREMRREEPAGKAALSFRFFRLPHPGRTFQAAFTSAALVLVIVSAGITTAVTAQSSLPGEPLYPMKKGMESVQFAISPDKAAMQLRLAQVRVEEIGSQLDHGARINPASFKAYEQHVDYVLDCLKLMPDEMTRPALSKLFKTGLSYEMILAGAAGKTAGNPDPQLGKAMEFSRRQLVLIGAAYDNPAILKSQLSIAGWDLESSYFRIEGILRSTSGRRWDIGGALLANVSSVTTPDAGMLVSVSGLALGDEIYVSRWEYREGVREGFRIEGSVNAVAGDGVSINVGGINIPRPFNVEIPAGPKMAVIDAAVRDNSLFAVHSEFRDLPSAAFMNGLLTGVDAAQKSITVEAAGTRFVIGLERSSITDRNGLSLSPEKLAAATGREIALNGLYSENGKLGAREVIAGIDSTGKE